MSNGLLSSVTGLPAASIPAGFAGALPVAVDLLGRGGADAALLPVAATVEDVLRARRVPPLAEALT